MKQNIKKANTYIFRLGDKLCKINAWDKEDAYTTARIMGYKGDIKGIRLYENKKQTIILRESELRHMIAESVKGAINELDWSTYANAEKKAKERQNNSMEQWHKTSNPEFLSKADKEHKRARNFSDAASKALSDKYGRNLCAWNEDDAYVVMDNDGEWTRGSNAVGPEPLGYYYRSPHDIEWDKVDWSDDDTMNLFYKYGNIPMPDDREKFDWEDDNKYKQEMQNHKIGREVDDYVHGRKKYVKGKGWTKNESVNRKIDRIVSECIRRNFR